MTHPCESCGLPIEAGPYCVHCVDAAGALQDFDTRLGHMVERRLAAFAGDQGLAERDALSDMARRPAWRDHPRVKASPV